VPRPSGGRVVFDGDFATVTESRPVGRLTTVARACGSELASCRSHGVVGTRASRCPHAREVSGQPAAARSTTRASLPRTSAATGASSSFSTTESIFSASIAEMCVSPSAR
jgi:hypothetical protein